jgi:AcrR family transcriptional regulator
MSQPDTKQRLLDAAEHLFARDGFHCTSLRALTTEAGTNLAAVNYHFGSKEALIEAVFERRLIPLNTARRERLEAVREAARRQGVRPSVQETLRAFIEPTLEFRDIGPGARDFVILVGRALGEADGSLRGLFFRLMEPVLLLLFETLCDALPELPRTTIYWRLYFTMGAMAQVMCVCDSHLPQPEGVAMVSDSQEMLQLLLPFITSGMEKAS